MNWKAVTILSRPAHEKEKVGEVHKEFKKKITKALEYGKYWSIKHMLDENKFQ